VFEASAILTRLAVGRPNRTVKTITLPPEFRMPTIRELHNTDDRYLCRGGRLAPPTYSRCRGDQRDSATRSNRARFECKSTSMQQELDKTKKSIDRRSSSLRLVQVCYDPMSASTILHYLGPGAQDASESARRDAVPPRSALVQPARVHSTRSTSNQQLLLLAIGLRSMAATMSSSTSTGQSKVARTALVLGR